MLVVQIPDVVLGPKIGNFFRVERVLVVVEKNPHSAEGREDVPERMKINNMFLGGCVSPVRTSPDHLVLMYEA